jgi:integrase
LNQLTEGTKQTTKRIRYANLKTFFNFVISTFDFKFHNPCDTPVLKKIFREAKLPSWSIIEKDVVDEIIFRTDNPRNRLILELMARGGMRIGEVLNLTPRDVGDRKLTIRDPKSGKEKEFIFIPQKIADRLKDYIRENNFQLEERTFQICYETARSMTKKAGDVVGIHLRPHDLRRHAATFASRSGVPLEIVSKIILRHANLSTTQRYLGKISDVEAIRWIENIHG